MTQVNQINKKEIHGNNAALNTILPEDPATAVLKLTKITQILDNLAEKETQILLQNDMTAFAILQDEKEIISSQYTKASKEFRNRLENFRQVDRSLLNKLGAIQTDLGEKSRSNSALVEQIDARARQKTQKTLITVQELGQLKPVYFEKTKAAEG